VKRDLKKEKRKKPEVGRQGHRSVGRGRKEKRSRKRRRFATASRAVKIELKKEKGKGVEKGRGEKKKASPRPVRLAPEGPCKGQQKKKKPIRVARDQLQ